MPCSNCKQSGHNKTTCAAAAAPAPAAPAPAKVASKGGEVQAHGFTWEQELLFNVYGATKEELEKMKYTSKMDLLAEYNRLDGGDLSAKTTRTPNAVCMADALRLFDAVASGKAFHLVVVLYTQDTPTTKKVKLITQLNLTGCVEPLFGTLTRSQIEELDKQVKSVPQKRNPTKVEYATMYSTRDSLQKSSGAIHLDIKCNSTQSRLQCSFNRFQEFVAKNPTRVVATSTTNEFRGGAISSQIVSSRRTFKKKQTV